MSNQPTPDSGIASQSYSFAHGNTRLTPQQIARRILAYPEAAITEYGRKVAADYIATGDQEAGQLLSSLPGKLFRSYSSLLGSEQFSIALDHLAILELEPGCAYACKQCYIDAPYARGEFMSWLHVQEIVQALAYRQRQVLSSELLDVLISDTLSDQVPTPENPLDLVNCLNRHRRNRFSNFSNHIMTYWRSNPVSWRDTLFDKHFGHVAQLFSSAFQLVDNAKLLELVEQDSKMTASYQRLFKGDPTRLANSSTLQTVVSTVPYKQGSIPDRALQYILDNQILDGELIRVTAPHPNLMASRAKNAANYWADLTYTLQATNPRLVYLFASSVNELLELVEVLSDSLPNSDRHWWIEARLAQCMIMEKQKQGLSDEAIVRSLAERLTKLLFTGTLEGRGSQFRGNPFFADKGTVMCVNGVVFSANGHCHYQACTDTAGEDLDIGQIVFNLEQRAIDELGDFLSSYPLVNRARESITKNLADIPRDKLRRRQDWFERQRQENLLHPGYRSAYESMQRLLSRSSAILL